jgi:hypothetical protein
VIFSSINSFILTTALRIRSAAESTTSTFHFDMGFTARTTPSRTSAPVSSDDWELGERTLADDALDARHDCGLGNTDVFLKILYYVMSRFDARARRLDAILRRKEHERTPEDRRFLYLTGSRNRAAPHSDERAVSVDECNQILAATENYAAIHGWSCSRHSSYPTTDIPLKDLQSIAALTATLQERILGRIAKRFGFIDGDLTLMDAFVVKYAHDMQRGLEKHTDGCLLSFNVLLNPSDDFTGGGTWFDLPTGPRTVLPRQGDLVMHDAKILHAGLPIESGERVLLVGFVDMPRDGVAHKMMAGR